MKKISKQKKRKKSLFYFFTSFTLLAISVCLPTFLTACSNPKKEIDEDSMLSDCLPEMGLDIEQQKEVMIQIIKELWKKYVEEGKLSDEQLDNDNFSNLVRELQTVNQKIEEVFSNLLNDLLKYDSKYHREIPNIFDVKKANLENEDIQFKVGGSLEKIQAKFDNYKEQNNSDYIYFWYEIYPSKEKTRNIDSNSPVPAKATLLKVTDVDYISLNNFATFDNGAKLISLRIDKSSPFKQILEKTYNNFEKNDSNSFTEEEIDNFLSVLVQQKINADYWEANLVLGEGFKISSASITPSNNVYTSDNFNWLVSLENNNNFVEINAKPSLVDENLHSNMVRYQWYKGTYNQKIEKNYENVKWQKLEGSTNPTLKGKIDKGDTALYVCEMWLENVANIPNNQVQPIIEKSPTVYSQVINLNVVESLSINFNTELELKIENKQDGKNNLWQYVREGDKVTVTPNFELGNKRLSDLIDHPNSDVDSVEYKWTKENDNTKSFSYSSSTGVLSFANISKENEGNYYCEVKVNFKNGGWIKNNSDAYEIKIGEPGQIVIRRTGGGTLNIVNGKEFNLDIQTYIAANADSDESEYDELINQKIKVNWELFSKDKSNKIQDLNEWDNKRSISLSKDEAYKLKDYSIKVTASYEDEQSRIHATPVSEWFDVKIIDPIISENFQNNKQITKNVSVGDNVTLQTEFNIENNDNNWKPVFTWQKSTNNGETWTTLDQENSSSLDIKYESLDENNIQYRSVITIANTADSYNEKYIYGPVTFVDKTTSFEEINEFYVKDFLNHISNETNLTINDLKNLISKYLRVDITEIDKIDLSFNDNQNFYNNYNLKNNSLILKITLKNQQWGSLLKNKPLTNLENYDKTLVIKDVEVNFSKLQISNENFVLEEKILRLQNWINKHKVYEELKNDLEQNKYKIIQYLIDDDILENFVDFESSLLNYSLSDSTAGTLEKTSLISLDIKLKKSYVFSDNKNSVIEKFNYKYIPINLDFFRQSQFSELISKFASLVKRNNDLSVDESKFNLPIKNNLKLRILKPENKNVRITNSSTYVYDLSFEWLDKNIGFDQEDLNEIYTEINDRFELVKGKKLWANYGIFETYNKWFDISYIRESNTISIQSISSIINIGFEDLLYLRSMLTEFEASAFFKNPLLITDSLGLNAIQNYSTQDGMTDKKSFNSEIPFNTTNSGFNLGSNNNSSYAVWWNNHKNWENISSSYSNGWFKIWFNTNYYKLSKQLVKQINESQNDNDIYLVDLDFILFKNLKYGTRKLENTGSKISERSRMIKLRADLFVDQLINYIKENIKEIESNSVVTKLGRKTVNRIFELNDINSQISSIKGAVENVNPKLKKFWKFVYFTKENNKYKFNFYVNHGFALQKSDNEKYNSSMKLFTSDDNTLVKPIGYSIYGYDSIIPENAKDYNKNDKSLNKLYALLSFEIVI